MAKEPFAAKLTSLWIGGFLFWILKGFSGKLTDQIVPEYQNRNVWVGYLISIIAVCIAVYFIFFKG
ncbi:hypothetical protein EQG63_11185 [Flavobacterium amnicola]|uniref:Uncharacterized protein n=1 Tax=Flavobacterium amnicola TaxID=2506422 RepID=A0A4Q1K0D8_9FLAO|nr:hypothetical protein [Flavobacterium amnicola]RXR17345.1 hypothetical protein EQG63_11185 [Flavobacterium amnicola]